MQPWLDTIAACNEAKPGCRKISAHGLEGGGKVTNRTWTISSHPDESAATGTFTISVKKVGLVSGWLHARPPREIVIEWRGAAGEFVPAPGAGPALLLAGGIGAACIRSLFPACMPALVCCSGPPGVSAQGSPCLRVQKAHCWHPMPAGWRHLVTAGLQ
jgi:hypothetical protein